MVMKKCKRIKLGSFYPPHAHFRPYPKRLISARFPASNSGTRALDRSGHSTVHSPATTVTAATPGDQFPLVDRGWTLHGEPSPYRPQYLLIPLNPFAPPTVTHLRIGPSPPSSGSPPSPSRCDFRTTGQLMGPAPVDPPSGQCDPGGVRVCPSCWVPMMCQSEHSGGKHVPNTTSGLTCGIQSVSLTPFNGRNFTASPFPRH